MKKEIKNKVQIYQAKNGAIELKFDDKKETVWASQKQIAEIFDVNIPAINKHIKNILKDGEVDKIATCAKLAQVQKEGKREVLREIEIYNLDIILAVGYRTNSSRAIEFRKWATKTLKEHITKGYTINKKVLEKNYQEFLKTVEDIKILSKNNALLESGEILDLIKSFSSTWFNLESYDKQALPEKGKRNW